MARDNVKALWVGPFGGELGRQQLIPGETVVEIPADEAENSAHWEPVTPKTKKSGDA
jgi:hypothetical protein